MIFFAKGLPPVSINFACFIILRFFTDSAPFRTRSLILWPKSLKHVMLFEGYKRAFCLQAQLSTLDLGIDTFYRFPILREGRVGPVLFRQSHCRTLNQQNASVLRIETLDNPLKVVNTSLSYHVSISWSKVWLKDIGPQETLLVCRIWFSKRQNQWKLD